MLRGQRCGALGCRVLAVAAFLLLIFALTTAVWAQDEPGAVPLFSVESEKIDLGVVPEGEEITAEFVVHNKGQAELRILKAKPS